mgnify:CR=1 FL=1
MAEQEETEETLDPFRAMYELGLLIFCDDAPDFPEVISIWGKEPGKHGVLKGMTMPDLPTHPHHWTIGALIMAGSVLGKLYYALESAKLAKLAAESALST